MASALFLAAQNPEPEPVRAARLHLERTRALVESGALPRTALDEAQLALAEAGDEAAVESLLLGKPAIQALDEQDIRRMTEAATRLVERQRAELAKARRLVEEGAAPAGYLEPFQEELNRRQQAAALASKLEALFREWAEMVEWELRLAEALENRPEAVSAIAERFDGSGAFLESQLDLIRLTYQRRFAAELPVSARGDTALHRSLGFDHRGRVDVALHPDSREGRWLLDLLRHLRVPYFAFRGAATGRSTGAHIHIGPPSARLHAVD